MVYKRSKTATTCPNKQFQNNSLFSLPICQEEINKVILVWVYEVETNVHKQIIIRIQIYIFCTTQLRCNYPTL